MTYFKQRQLTRRATTAKKREATAAGPENKILLLLSSKNLKYLAVQYTRATTIP